MSERWVRVCESAEVLPGEMHAVWMDDIPLVLFNLDGMIYALRDQCTHEDYELSAGHFDAGAGAVECTLHGARFDVRDGSALCAPAYTAAERFETRLEDGGVYVRQP